jgi:hypothetical protein
MTAQNFHIVRLKYVNDTYFMIHCITSKTIELQDIQICAWNCDWG